jgi:hypothetical protein
LSWSLAFKERACCGTSSHIFDAAALQNGPVRVEALQGCVYAAEGVLPLLLLLVLLLLWFRHRSNLRLPGGGSVL